MEALYDRIGDGYGRYRRADPRIAARIAAAEGLPLADESVDAAMAVLTIQHWADPERGVAEMKRVARGRVVPEHVLDPDARRTTSGLALLDDALEAQRAGQCARDGGGPPAQIAPTGSWRPESSRLPNHRGRD